MGRQITPNGPKRMRSRARLRSEEEIIKFQTTAADTTQKGTHTHTHTHKHTQTHTNTHTKYIRINQRVDTYQRQYATMGIPLNAEHIQ